MLRRAALRLAPAYVKKDPNLLSGAARGALERLAEDEARRPLLHAEALSSVPPEGALIVRGHNSPSFGERLPQSYAAHPFNFTPLRQVPPGFAAADRAVREVAWESRFDLLQRRVLPRYYSECPGTPRREMQMGLVGGVRVRPVQNPSVRLNPAKRYRLNAWASKDWKKWRPTLCYIRGSRRRYRVPEDIAPYRDELGEWHKPRVSGRYKGDIEKQYYMNSLPWVWANDYFRGKEHFMDREPRGQRRWYKREFRKAIVAEALKKREQLLEEHRQERREAKRLSWLETIVLEFAGEQLAAPYIRQRRLPKI